MALNKKDLQELKRLAESLEKQIRDAEKGSTTFSVNDLASKKAQLKAYSILIERQKDYIAGLEDSAEKWDEISKAITNISISNILGQVKNVDSIIVDINSKIAGIQGQISTLIPTITTNFQRLNASSNVFAEFIKNITKFSPEMAAELEHAALQGKDLSNFVQRFGAEGINSIIEATEATRGLGGTLRDSFINSLIPVLNLSSQITRLESSIDDLSKKVVRLDLLFQEISKNFLRYFGFPIIIPQLQDFDNRLAKIKREFLLPSDSFDKASKSMQELVSAGAQFGISQEQNFALVKQLSEESRSANIASIANVAKQLQAIPAATGIAIDQVGDIAGKMLFFGASATRIEKAFQNIAKYSGMYSLNVTKVSAKIAEALPRWQRMGFKGGEESLVKMAAKAEKLGVSINNLLDLSDKFLDINTSLEAAADLSMLGGAAGQTNFLEIMRAAQEGGDALMDLTGRMTSDIGKLNSSDQLELNFIDRNRLKAIAEATGQDIESISNQIKERLQDQAKASFIPKSLFGGLGKEEKEFLLSKVVRDKSGKFQLEGLEGVTDLRNVSKEQIIALKNKSVQEQADLAKRAAERRALEESFRAFTDSMVRIMNVFHPLMQKLTQAMNWFNARLKDFSAIITNVFGADVGRWVKASMALGAVLLLTLGPANIARFLGSFTRVFTTGGKNLVGGLGSIFSKLKDAFRGGAGGTTTAPTPPTITAPAGAGRPSPLLTQLRRINPAQLMGVAAAIAALGVAFLGMGAGIKLAAEGLSSLVNSFKGLENAGAALGAVSVVMGGFIGMLALMIPIIPALGGVAGGAAIPLLALGAAFLLMGGGVFLAATGLSTLVDSVGKLGKNVNILFTASLGIGALAASLFVISPALIAFGAAGLIALPAFVALSASMLLTSFALKSIMPSLQQLTKLESKNIADFGKNILPFTKSLMLFIPVGLASPLIALGVGAGVIAAQGLQKITNTISGIKNVEISSLFEFIDKLPSVVTPLMKFSTIGFLTPLLIGASISLKKITDSISQIKSLNTNAIISMSTFLPQLGKSLAQFSIAGLTAPLTILGAGALFIISKSLSTLSNIDSKNILGIGEVLTKIIPGLLAFSIAGVISVGAILSAGALSVIAKSLSTIPTIDSKNILGLGEVLKNIIPGLLAFSSVGILTVGAIVGANALSAVAKSLSLIPTIDSKNILGLEQILTKLTPGLLMFSSIGILSVGAILGASVLSKVANSLSLIPSINTKNLLDIGNVLTKIIPGLLAFSTTGFLLTGAMVGAIALSKIAQSLSIVPAIDSKNILVLGNVLKKIIPDMLLFSVTGPLMAGAILGSISLSKISKSLSTISMIDYKNILGLGEVLKSIIPGLLSFSAVGVLTAGAIVGAMALSAVAKSLSIMPTIDSKNILGIGEVLKKIIPGFLAFSATGILSVGAALGASSLMVISNSLKALSGLDYKNISLLGDTLLKITPGILAFSGAGLISIGSLLGSIALGTISKSLIPLASIDFKKLLTLGDVLKSISVGLIAFSAAGIFSIGSIASAGSLSIISKALNSFSKTLGSFNGAQSDQILNLGKMLDNIIPSLAKMGLMGIFAPSILLSSSALLVLSKSFKGFKDFDPSKLLGLGETLSSLTPALLKFSLVGLMAGGAIFGATALNLLSKSFVGFNNVDINKLNNLGLILSNISSGLAKFSIAGFLSGGAIIGAGALKMISGSLQALGSIKLSNISILGSQLVELGSGLLKFSIAGFASGGALLGGLTLNVLTKSLNNISTIDFGKVSGLNEFLLNISGGLLKFSLAGLVSGGAILGATALTILSKAFQGFSGLNIGSFSMLGKVLSDISPGLLKFSAAGFLSAGTFMASTSLGILSKTLKSFEGLNLIKISTIGNILTSLVPGLSKFSIAGFLSGGATLGALALGAIGKSLQNFSIINFDSISNLGNILTSLVPGLSKFSIAGFLSGGAILGATALNLVSKAFVGLNGIKLDQFSVIGDVLSNITPGLLKFSAAGLLSTGAILSATALKMLASAFSGFSNLNLNGFGSLGILLGEMSTGLAKFSVAGFLSGGAILGSIAISSLSKALKSISGLNIKNVDLFSTTLDTLLVPLTKFSAVGLLSPLLLPASASLGLLSKSLTLFGTINPNNFENISIGLNSLVSPLIKFSSIGLLSGLIASSGLSFKSLSEGLNNLNNIDVSSLSVLGPALTALKTPLLSFSVVGLASALFGALGFSLSSLSKGFESLTNVDFTNLSGITASLSGIVDPLKSLSIVGVLSPILLNLGFAMKVLGFGFSSFVDGVKNISGIDLKQISGLSSVLEGITKPLMNFSLIGLASPLLVLGSSALMVLGKSLQFTAGSLASFSNISWDLIGNISNNLGNLINSLTSFGFKGFIASPGIIAISSSISTLGSSLGIISNSFNESSKTMAAFNVQLEKLKANTKSIEGTDLAQLEKINKNAVTASKTSSAIPAVFTGNNQQTVKIEPIQIDLKFEGRDLHRVIVEANYNRS